MLIAKITHFDATLAWLAIFFIYSEDSIVIVVRRRVLVVVVIIGVSGSFTSRKSRVVAILGLVGVLAAVLVTEFVLRYASKTRTTILAYPVDLLALALVVIVLAVLGRCFAT